MKFTPEEMAYDIPDDTSHFFPVGRGEKALFAKPSKEMLEAFHSQLARIDPDVRKAFPDDERLNEALRKVIELQQLQVSEPKRKKSA